MISDYISLQDVDPFVQLLESYDNPIIYISNIYLYLYSRTGITTAIKSPHLIVEWGMILQ